MKKKEILKLINANKFNNNNSLINITRYKNYPDITINKENWFPQIIDLEDEFNVLSEEVEECVKEYNENKKYIENINCNHEVRLEHYGLFGSHYKCIFCDKSIEGDNNISWKYSVNRNKYCVNLTAKYQMDEDLDYIKEGYTNEKVYEIITDILKDKNDEDEIDLVQEFKKLNLDNCTINEEKKINERYILIISGTNKYYIDEDSFITKKNNNLGIEFLKYFSNLLNVKIELIDINEKENYKELFANNYYLEYKKYNTLEELNNILLEEINIPFNFIIDVSDLYEYTLNNKTTKESIDINLKKLYPNSKIIKIKDLSKKSLEEIYNILKTTSAEYAYNKNNYYYVDNNDIKYENLENTCHKIKKLLK